MTINLVNKKKYIGKDVKNKKSYLGSGVVLAKAIKKYGKDNFIKIVLEKCSNKQHLEEREKWWINFFDAVKSKDFYNMLDGGTGGAVVGHIISEETKKKIKNSLTGKKRPEAVVKKFYKPILQYDYKGFFIKEFFSKKNAEEELGVTIGTLSPDTIKFSGGYFLMWKKDDNFERQIPVKKVYKNLEVGRIDFNGNLLEKFENLSLAIQKYEND
jgi:group I intron endonuclease